MDDSVASLTLLKKLLATSPDIEVVGTARNGKEALKLFPAARPKVICTDYLMPVMDGLELIQETMATYPRPILVISSTINSKDADKRYALLEAGAVDIFPKPNAAMVPGSAVFNETARLLVQKIRILAGVFVITRRPQDHGPTKIRPSETQSKPVPMPAVSPARIIARHGEAIKIVTVGSSTGGPQILQSIFEGLAPVFPCPILCVQHISKGFLEGLVSWLHSQSRMRVKIAEDGEEALPGTIYFPREDAHLEVNGNGRLTMSQAPLVDGHRPSVTTTFKSVARHYGKSAMGILLTGMGSDGASGLQTMHQSGGLTIAQNEASCVVFGMPKQAIELGAAQYTLPPEQISQVLQSLVSK